MKYPYLGIIINQSLRLKEHEQKLRSFEKLMNLKISMIGRILKKTRSKRILFKTLIKSKLSYGISPLIKHDEKFRLKWESMLYRLLKRLFGIRSKVSKTKLFNQLNVMDWDTKEWHEFIDYLSPNTIKFKLDWLFSTYAKKQCSWKEASTRAHIVENCPKTTNWREKWSKVFKQLTGKDILQSILHDYKLKQNFWRMAIPINAAIEDLLREYLGKYSHNYSYIEIVNYIIYILWFNFHPSNTIMNVILVNNFAFEQTNN